MRKYKSLDIEEKLQIYNEALDLRKRGLSYRGIRKIIEEKHGVRVYETIIWKWICRGGHPLRHYNRVIAGPELAYAISAWLGDGRMGHGKRYREYKICLSVKDYDFAEEWGRCIAKALRREKPYRPKWDKYHRRWVTRARSKLLYNLLRRAKDDPWILMPYLEKYPADACRGFFDAEGGVNADSYELVAYNTDLRVIQLFKALLEKIDIQCSIRKVDRKNDVLISPSNSKVYHRNKLTLFRIAVHGKENIMKFAEKVGFTIARKRAELGRLLEKYNTMKISNNHLKKCARALIAANFVRLGLVRTQTEAARLLSINQSAVSDHLRNKKKASKLLKYPEIEQLSREYFYSRSDDVITRVQKILQAIIEIYH